MKNNNTCLTPRKKLLSHLYMNHMGIEKTSLMKCKSFYWIKRNVDIEDTVKYTLHVLISSQHSQRTKHYHTKHQGSQGNLLGYDIFAINNRHYLCIVGYHGKFPVIKQMKGLSTGNLIQTCRIIQHDSVRCRHKLHIRQVYNLLQVTQLTSCCIIISQLSKQHVSGSMH